jgi:phosphatidate cytidylyltransferase
MGAALWWMTPFSPAVSALIAFVIGLMGFAGGLTMSAIKRDRGIKDYGTLIEGHGGILDRIDSMCLAASVFFHVVRHFYVP